MTLKNNPPDGLEVDKAHLREAQQLVHLDPSSPRGWGFTTNAFSIDWITLPLTWKENWFCCMGTILLPSALPTPGFSPHEWHTWSLCSPCRDTEPKRSVQHPTSSSWEEHPSRCRAQHGSNALRHKLPRAACTQRWRKGLGKQAVPGRQFPPAEPKLTRQTSYQKSKYQSTLPDWLGCCYQLSNNRVVRRQNHRSKQLWQRTLTNLVINT